MSQSLKWAFMRLAENTFYTLEHCRRVKHQIQEETLTDLNMLNLKRNHSTQLTTHTFSKHEEGKNGGDWEWWLTNSSRKRWLCIRVQAKVLKLKTDRFEHLHYKSRKSGIYQLDRLKAECAKSKWRPTPLYCFYLHYDSPPHNIRPNRSRTYHFYGCSVAPVNAIEALRKNNINDLSSVLAQSRPWHELFCGGSSSDLLASAKAFLEKIYGAGYQINIADQKDGLPPYVSRGSTSDFQYQSDEPIVVFNSSPPSYVLKIMESLDPDDEVPEGIQSVLVMIDNESEDKDHQ